MTLQPDPNLDSLLKNHRNGYALEQPFYLDPAIFEEEMTHIFMRQWQYADHISRIPKKGDYFVHTVAGEEIIIVRGEGDQVYAHYNVCRHRGSRVCVVPQGRAKRFTCPYHAWSYRLDGSLAAARAMPPDFNPAEFSLKSCQVRLFEGLIFINLTPVGAGLVPDFDEVAAGLLPWLKQADLRHTKIAAHENYRSSVNWKIALENYFECYHCVTSHPEFCKIQLHALRDAVATEKSKATFEDHNAAWAAQAQALGHINGGYTRGNMGLPDADNYNAQAYYAERMLIHHDLDGAYDSLNPELQRPTKLLGSYQADDQGQVDWGILPSVFVYTSCTSTVLMRLTPLGPQDTDLTMTWLVHEEAREGVDYEVEGLTWLDKVTMSQDDAITRATQAGVASRAYSPGPYAQLEAEIRVFHHDYLRLMRHGRSLG
jgi:Rieske 2Fe-2S family protein